MIRLLCRLLGCRWAYLIPADDRPARLCVRCGATEWELT